MRDQAAAAHVANMSKLVRMVEHCTVQKVDLPWPALYTPKLKKQGKEEKKGAEEEEVKGRPKRVVNCFNESCGGDKIQATTKG